MGKRRWTDEHPEEQVEMTEVERTVNRGRQRHARNDPDMRDGDSGRGNPYESSAPWKAPTATSATRPARMPLSPASPAALSAAPLPASARSPVRHGGAV